jgi:hypothetical protein
VQFTVSRVAVAAEGDTDGLVSLSECTSNAADTHQLS